MNETESLSNKLKQFLERKLIDCQIKIKKLKKKRKIIKILYTTSVITSISLSVIIVSLTSAVAVPVIVITTLSAASGILTGVSAKFNLLGKKIEINKLIEKLNKIQIKLDYIISLNGNLTKDEFDLILKQFI